MKICYLTNIPSPYKTALFTLISQQAELSVVYERENEKGRESQWISHKEDMPYRYFFCREDHHLPAHLAETCDILINGDYSSPDAGPFVRAFHRLNKPAVMQADGGLAIPRLLIDPIIRSAMKQNDWFLSSGIETDQYYAYYRIPADRILHYRFSSLSEKENQSHAEMRQNRKSCRAECGYQEPFILFSVGQQIPRKGYDILAKAAAGMSSEVGIYIAGGAPEKNVLALIEKHHLSQFHFVGFKDKKELESYYAGADLFVLPTRYDIWGLVINEAMSFGLPVLSTDRCVAAKEFSHMGGAVAIIPSEDPEALCTAANDLYQDASRRALMEQESLRIIHPYTIENTCLDILKNLQEVLS